MEIKSIKDEDWGKYKGRCVQVLLGLNYDSSTTTAETGELVKVMPYTLDVRLSNGVVHTFYKNQCYLVIDKEEQ